MDDLDTPASPVGENDEWYQNAGAETPEHIEDPTQIENSEHSDELEQIETSEHVAESEHVEAPENVDDSETVEDSEQIKDPESIENPKSSHDLKPVESPVPSNDDGEQSEGPVHIEGLENNESPNRAESPENIEGLDQIEDSEQIEDPEHSDDPDDERPALHRSDFDEMMAQKKKERKRTKRRRRDGAYDLISDADDQIKDLVELMMRAANQDRTSNESRQPAFQKQKLLPLVRQTLLKADFFEALLDNGMMSAVSEWLAPLPDKSLPSLEVRTTLLKILSDFPNLEQGILRQSGLGKAVMYLLKHPRESKENKLKAAKLIREWSRPIFQLESDYTSMSREERYERDTQQNTRKRRHESQDDIQSSSHANRTAMLMGDEEEEVGPGGKGFVPRARVPKPSMKAYVNRPVPQIEGRFAGPSKGRASTRFDVAQREFKERTKTRKARRHIGVSIAGNKMDI
ncbi:IWS1-like protein [Aphelenchoides besseyi]|nr:IWS1-like protein [Aphelenchoides besseyi]